MARFPAMALPTLWLAPLLVVIMAGGLLAPWSSVATVDERTYLEMTMGIQDTGLPLIDNGPVDQFAPLQARWNLYREGQLWGAMAPGFPYLSAWLFESGGIRTVIRSNLVLLALLVLAVSLTGREISARPEIGPAAAYVALLSIPLWTNSLGFLPYSLAIAGFTWALFCASRAMNLDRTSWAIAAGLLAGLATTCQMLIFPMLIGLVAALGWYRWRLGLAASLGASPALGAMAWINHIRFGTWNPLSDGPCAWRGCPDSGIDPQSVGQMLLGALPFLVWLTAGTLIVWNLRKLPPRGLLAVCAVILVPLALVESLRQDLHRYFLMGWRLLVDVGAWENAENTSTTADGLGTFIGPNVIKALLQGSPALVLAAAARPTKPKLALLWFPIAALFGMLLLRASMPVDFALGHPFLNLRYLMPAAAPLAILATLGARRLGFGLPHLALAALVAALLRVTLWSGTDDLEIWRRRLLLRVSLLVAIALAATIGVALRRSALVWRQAASVLAAVAFGWGVGVSLGVDLPATIRLRDRVENLVSELELHLPQRLALVGYPDRLDAPLTLKTDRDIQYLDLKEVADWSEAAPPIHWWISEERPVFALLPLGEVIESPHADLEIRTIDATLGLVEIVSSQLIGAGEEGGS